MEVACSNAIAVEAHSCRGRCTQGDVGLLSRTRRRCLLQRRAVCTGMLSRVGMKAVSASVMGVIWSCQHRRLIKRAAGNSSWQSTDRFCELGVTTFTRSVRDWKGDAVVYQEASRQAPAPAPAPTTSAGQQTDNRQNKSCRNYPFAHKSSSPYSTTPYTPSPPRFPPPTHYPTVRPPPPLHYTLPPASFTHTPTLPPTSPTKLSYCSP